MWNWQQNDWPHFTFDRKALEGLLGDEISVERMFREGIAGFKGGLSAGNYISITGAPRTTVTRDLNNLVAKGALTKTGQLKHTRYHLNIAGQKEA